MWFACVVAALVSFPLWSYLSLLSCLGVFPLCVGSSSSQESKCVLDRAAVPDVVLVRGLVVVELFASVCEELLCGRDSCSLLYLLFELTYCCLGRRC